ncbi:MAG: metallophosphoesterase [bacterium]
MKYFFDILILILIAISTIPAFIIFRHRRNSVKSWEHKHKIASLSIALLLAFGATIVIYGSFVEPRFLIVKQEKIDLEKITAPIKIAILADIQVGPYKQTEYAEKAVNKILSLNPDIVFLAGDHINNSGDNIDETKYLKPLEKLARAVPVFAVHGNHEYGVSDDASFFDPKYRLPDLSDNVKSKMEEMGIKYLVNEKKEIEINGQKMYIFGGDSFWAQKLDLRPLAKNEKSLATIALIHNPAAIFSASGYDIDMMVAGHTHGGQIRLPLLGPVFTVDNVIPRSWHSGWVEYSGMNMYVTSGAGETGPRSRLLTPPEIVLLTVY